DDPYHTTIVDPPRRSRTSYAVMAAMLLGGAAGLGFGFLRAGNGEGAEVLSASLPEAVEASSAGLEVLPSLDGEAGSAELAQRREAASTPSTAAPVALANDA